MLGFLLGGGVSVLFSVIVGFCMIHNVQIYTNKIPRKIVTNSPEIEKSRFTSSLHNFGCDIWLNEEALNTDGIQSDIQRQNYCQCQTANPFFMVFVIAHPSFWSVGFANIYPTQSSEKS